MFELPEKTKSLLDIIVSRKSLGSAYLFFGEPGTQLQQTALYLIQKWRNEIDGVKITPEQFETPESNLVDFVRHTEESNSIKINTIRELQESIKYGPLHQSKLFIVIDTTEKITKQAANAFLKTLEEPPENTCFFLLSNNLHTLPKTIMSRCTQLFIPKSSSIPKPTHTFAPFSKVISSSLFERLTLSQSIVDEKIPIDELIYTWLEEITVINNPKHYSYVPTLLKTLENQQYNVNKRLQLDALLSSLE
ncbi:hypothetical protein DID80_03185 [Candidatus Marinamargulisbacteria bacterium SCGC AAA071-K20]|nr:hypothetical protein DID80_03185 [Candidatus Marinamargulisbacteria bacterium SCGC AAA071-K20]